jgi:AmmeMemoRadiSam system protein A
VIDCRPLTDEEGRALLAAARQALSDALQGLPARDPGPLPSRLLLPQAAFVTLRDGDRLRGCIGVLEAKDPLAAAVARCAAGAGLEDPRFPAVTLAELPRLRIEISVLGPPRAARDPAEIEIGRHGLLARQGSRRGVLLPQVAIEHGWDGTMFLRETCRKAGLPPDAWEKGATFELFEAQVIREPDGPRSADL